LLLEASTARAPCRTARDHVDVAALVWIEPDRSGDLGQFLAVSNRRNSLLRQRGREARALGPTAAVAALAGNPPVGVAGNKTTAIVARECVGRAVAG